VLGIFTFYGKTDEPKEKLPCVIPCSTDAINPAGKPSSSKIIKVTQ